MLGNNKVLAVIQARGGSKGIPKKNIYPIDGHPLIAYTIYAGLNSRYIDKLIVSTDSEEIAELSTQYGAHVPFLRPANLAGDTVASVTSLIHAVQETENLCKQEYGIIIEMPCVAPLRTSADVDGAIEKLVATGANSVISVVNTGEKHPVRLKRIINDLIYDFCSEYPEPKIGSRRQDLEPCFIRNGAIYAMTRETLLKLETRHGPISRPYEMPEERSLNIDGWMDLKLCELLIKSGQCENFPSIKKRSPQVLTTSGNNERQILISAPVDFMSSLKAKFESSEFGITYAYGATKHETIASLTDMQGWICSPSPKYTIDYEILKNANQLKVIGTPSTGTNHIDLDYCKRRNIKVISMRGTDVIETVTASSEYTLALLLATVRNIPQASAMASKGKWREVESMLRSIELRGKILGIVGLGRIGGNLAKYAIAMKMKVIAYDPYREPSDPRISKVDNVDELLKNSDIISICVHLNDETRGMVDKSWFERMKQGVYFINTSRGEIIDEIALLENLKNKKIRSAGLDVISNEQNSISRSNKLIEYASAEKNLILTPHIAGLTKDSEERTTTYVYDEMIKLLTNA